MPAPIDSRNAAKFAYLVRRFDEVAPVEGDIVECGVAGGMTFSMLALLMEMEGRDRSLWGFDSFQGFPTPSAHDAGHRNPQKGELGSHTTEVVRHRLRGAGIPERTLSERIHLVEGFFDATLGRYSGGPIALLHLDVDLHDSYRQCLEVLYPQVADGGVVMFDEYDHEYWPGATKAIDEYFGEVRNRILRVDVGVRTFHYLHKHPEPD